MFIINFFFESIVVREVAGKNPCYWEVFSSNFTAVCQTCLNNWIVQVINIFINLFYRVMPGPALQPPFPKNHHSFGGNPDPQELHYDLSAVSVSSLWGALCSLKIICGGGVSLLGHRFCAMASALTDATELLCPSLLAASARTGSQLQLNHRHCLGSSILLPEPFALLNR